MVYLEVTQGGHRHAQTVLMGSMCCVQVAHHGSRREMRPPAEKTTPYFNLFAVSARGLIRKLETSDTDTELNISLTMV